MSNKVIISIISAIVVVLLIVAGFFVFSPKEDVSNKIAKKATDKETSEPVPTEFPEDLLAESEEMVPQETTADTELEEARSIFPDAQATENYTADEVKLQMYAAFMYVNATLSDPTLTTGEYMKADVFDVEYFNQYYSPHFTTNGLSKILGLLTGMSSEEYDDDIRQNFVRQLRATTGIEPQYEDVIVTPDPACLTSNTNCFAKDIEFDSFEAYEHNETGQLVIKVIASNYPVFYKDGVEGGATRAHTFYLTMAKSDIEGNVENGYSSYAIDDIDGELEASDWSAK